MRKVNNNNYVYNKNQNQKQIISSSNTDFPMNSNSNFPINNIPQKLGNILEPTSPQEMNPEILNISKVKDGFFIGDRISAISIEVITEFKISHILYTSLILGTLSKVVIPSTSKVAGRIAIAAFFASIFALVVLPITKIAIDKTIIFPLCAFLIT